jgi:hypothetical protein
LDLIAGLIELFKDILDNLLPADDSSKIIDSPKIIEVVKE